MTERLTIDEAAAQLRKKPRWFREWLRKHPADKSGEPYFTPVGRDKIFHQADIARIEFALREGVKCRSSSGKTPNFEIRGTHLGCRVETSSGTPKRSVALKQLKRIEECIEEHGQYPAPELKPRTGEPTFLGAAIAYMRDGGSRRYVAPLVRHFGETPLPGMTQKLIDDAASEMLPTGAPDYRNRAVYTPVIAILRHVLKDDCPAYRRPKGAKGRTKKDFMWPVDAFAVIDQADTIDPEFGLYLRLLLYTGIRKSEGLHALAADTKPEERAAWLRTSKNEDPRMLKLREDIVGPLAKHLEGHTGDRLFKFNDGGTSNTC